MHQMQRRTGGQTAHPEAKCWKTLCSSHASTTCHPKLQPEFVAKFSRPLTLASLRKVGCPKLNSPFFLS
eukprot:3524877-Amphidinium_carterae.1